MSDARGQPHRFPDKNFPFLKSGKGAPTYPVDAVSFWKHALASTAYPLGFFLGLTVQFYEHRVPYQT